MSAITFLYIFMLSAFVGVEIIRRIPVILHTPLMSGTNFIHGIILIGAVVALGHASTPLQRILAAIAVFIATINVVGGFVTTYRMLKLFHSEKKND